MGSMSHGDIALIGVTFGFVFMGLLNAAYNLWPHKMVKVSQWLCRHKYQPCFSERWYENKRTKQRSKKQFRVQCCKCKKWTPWMALSRQESWGEENKASWLNGDD